MGVRVYRWSILHALTRILASLLGWMLILFLPGFLFWGAFGTKPGRELPVVAGIVGVVLACWLLHTRKYWRRIFDRSPQLELHIEFLRATQLKKDIGWEDVVQIRGRETTYQDDSILSLCVARREFDLDISGLDVPMREIFKAVEEIWRRRTQHGTANCGQCDGSGTCYCVRKGGGVAADCARCGGTGKCHVCYGTGKK